MSRLVQIPPEAYSPTAFAEFNPAAGFSIPNARAMMWMSQLAYEAYQGGPSATIETVGKTMWKFTSVVPFAKHQISIKASYDTCGVIGDRPNAVVLAFAGTDPAVWETVITDVTLRRGEDTHAGFQAAADAVKAGGGPGHCVEPGRREAAFHHRSEHGCGGRRAHRARRGASRRQPGRGVRFWHAAYRQCE